MDRLSQLRQQYGDAYITELPDGTLVPWRPLSLGDFLEYEVLLKSGRYPLSCLENEIFVKCVLDPALTKNIHSAKAGNVSVVCESILNCSGPANLEDINQALNYGRAIVHRGLHGTVGTITQAFPAYKPEEVYDMNFSTLMLRLALAEAKLLRTGMLQEPITFENPEEAQKNQKKKKQPPSRLKQQYEQQRSEPQPIEEEPVEQTIITNHDIMEHKIAAVGHENDVVHRQQMIDNTASIYQEYIEQMERGEKVSIKTPGERAQYAEQRSSENRAKLVSEHKEQLVRDKEELKDLVATREKERKRRKRQRFR